MFKLLRQGNFGWLWFAGLISMIGDWVAIGASHLCLDTQSIYHSFLSGTFRDKEGY